MKVVVADEMQPSALELLRETRAEIIYRPPSLREALADAEILIVRSATKVTEELISGAKKLKVVARGGVGLDNVDAEACKKRGIEVLNTPGASTNSVAELAIGLMLSCLRNISRSHHAMKEGKWLKSLPGAELSGKTLGIVGCGRIGLALAEKARHLGMHVIGYNPPPRPISAAIEMVGLDELYRSSDIISLHVPLHPTTERMINRDSISRMKDGVILINTSRGQVIDENALYEAAKSGKVRAAGLDVYWEEPYEGKLLELDNICFTPHIGASTEEAQARIGSELAAIISSKMR
ncbi:MAG: hydroxyacid dehydrogenase [Candidatus Bilamarchaeaceae archaeon]